MSGVLADYARFKVYGGSLSAIVIAISFVFAGYFVLKHPQVWLSTIGEVTKFDGLFVTIKYTPKDSTQEIVADQIQTTSKTIKVGDKMTIYYDSKNVYRVSLQKQDTISGWIFIAIGVAVMLISSCVMAVFSNTSNNTKTLIGGVEGAGNAAGVAERVFFRN